MNERCKHCGRTIVLWGGDGKLWVHKDDDHAFCSMDGDDNNDRAEPSPGPEAAPASEAQAPEVPRYRINCEGELEESSRFGILVTVEDHLAEIASLREKLALAERKGWNEAIEACERIVDESDGYSERISALRKGEK